MRDKSIRTYCAKHDFTVTSEPAPRSQATKGKQHLFVVQKHAPRNLHWDFRLKFEGRLPDGPYGAGTAEIRDPDTWSAVGDPEDGLRNRELKFEPKGQRLKGGLVLVHLKPRKRNRNENWLLMKECAELSSCVHVYSATR